MGLKDQFVDAYREGAGKPPADRTPPATQRFEYDVVELREKLLSGLGDAPTNKLRQLLNDRAREGWQLKHLVTAEVAGMVTKRDGWMVIFEREIDRS